MKKMLYLILPALFLSAGVNYSFAQVKEIKELSKEQLSKIDEIKQELDNKQKANEEKIYGEYMLKTPQTLQLVLEEATEINFDQRVNLQNIVPVHEDKPLTASFFKLKLDKDYVFSNIPSGKTYLWDNFLGKYSYKFTFELVKTQEAPYLLIKVEPIESKEPTIPYAYMAFIKYDNAIHFTGYVYPIDDTLSGSGFRMEILK